MFNLTELEQAAAVVYQTMPATPQYSWPQLCKLTGCDVWVKHENHTPTSAFKVRGGLVLVNKLLAHSDRPQGLVSATRGNHGQSLSYAGRQAGLPVTIVVPECNNADQNRAIESFGANLVVHGEDFEAARQYSAELQQQSGFHMVAPFERNLVIGVATYALELFSQLADLDTVYVPIGMGSGICALIKTRDLLGLTTKIVGVVAQGAPAMALSLEAGQVVTTADANTIADGVATRAPMEEAFDIIARGAERIVRVSDQEIKSAMYHYYAATHNIAEGAGATPLAGLLQERSKMQGKKVGLILTGSNIDFGSFSRYLSEFVGD